MASFVKMRTVIGVLLASISIAACSSHQPYYADKRITTNSTYQHNASVYDLVINWSRDKAYEVPPKYRLEHERCVYFALDNANLGETCKWRVDGSSGDVRVVAIFPNTCHILLNTVWYRGKTASWEDKACLKNNQWKFYNR